MGGLIPLGDASRRRRRFPVVTTLIILMNVVVFFLEIQGGSAFVYRWAVIPANIVAGRAWLTLGTSMFLHSGWLHILGNMIFLWAFGPAMEDSMSPWRFAWFYLLGGLVAMLGQVALVADSTIPTLGASGAIAAVMGAFLVTYPRDRIRSLFFFFFFVRITFIPAVFLIGFWFLVQLVNVGSVVAVRHGGVAYAAHVSGFIFGALTVRLFQPGRAYPPRPSWPQG